MRQTIKEVPVLLNSWKKIATYLDRGVRTVQRWEHELGLPIHRIGKGPRSPVYATTSELQFWVATSGALREANPRGQLLEMPRWGRAAQPRRRDAVEESHRLLRDAHALARTIAETSVRQRKQAEALQARIIEIRGRIKR